MTMFASLYRAMRQIGMPNPRDVDELEIWETAVLLDADVNGEDGGIDPNDPHAHLRADLEYRQQRAAFAAGERIEPPDRSTHFEWGEPDGDATQLMEALASGSSLDGD